MVHLIAILIRLANTIIPWIVGAEILGKGFMEGLELFVTFKKWTKKLNASPAGFIQTAGDLQKGRRMKAKKIEKKYVKEEKRHKKSETAEEKKHEHREMTDFKDIEKLAEKKSKFKRK